MLIEFIIFSFVFIIMAGVLNRRYETIGNVQSVDTVERFIRIKCDNAVLYLHFVSENIMRVVLDHGHGLPGSSSYAVSGKCEDVKFSIEKKDRVYEIISINLRIEINSNPCRLAIYDRNGILILKDHESLGMSWRGSRITCFKELHDESFYGLGEKTGMFNKRGKAFTMWNSDTPAYTTKQDPLYQSHPFFVSRHNDVGFGIFLDNSYRTNFNFGAGNDQFYSFEAEDGRFDYYFIYGPDYTDVIANYSNLIGKMPLPPKWSLGYQQCRWNYATDHDVLGLAKKFRNKGIPCDTIYLDIGYMDGYRCFTWHTTNFSDPNGMLDELHAMGFKVVVIIDPGIKVDSNYRAYKEGTKGGHFCTYPDGSLYRGQVWPGWCCFPDFSRKQTREWWGTLYQGLIDAGVDGFWNDMNEPATWGGTFPDVIVFNNDGDVTDHSEMHNLYGALMAKATYEGVLKLKENERPFVLTRSGYVGVQRYATIWTGDNVSSWEHLRLAIRMCLGLSMSGYSFCGSDIGGFMGSPTGELFCRWLQFGLFCPLCRTHSAINTPEQEPWSYGEEFESINKKMIKLRYRLLPYLYNEFYESMRSGIPILRPMILESDNVDKVSEMDDQYMFGHDILVAPVIENNGRHRAIYLPRGRWFNFWTNEQVQGDTEVVVEAPLDQIPLFVRGGSIVPMQEETQFVEENNNFKLYLHIYPDEGTFVRSFYEDDGKSLEYLKGEFRISTMKLHKKSEQITFSIKYSSGGYKVSDRKWILIFHGITYLPQSVVLNQNEIFEEDIGEAVIKNQSCSIEQGNLNICIDDSYDDYELVITL